MLYTVCCCAWHKVNCCYCGSGEGCDIGINGTAPVKCRVKPVHHTETALTGIKQVSETVARISLNNTLLK